MFSKYNLYAFTVLFFRRGAIHVHMLIWVQENSLPKDTVVAEFPRCSSDDPYYNDVQHLRTLVQALQIHKCYPERCHRICKGKYIKRCKYGFPFHLQDRVDQDKNNLRYQYVRRCAEDQLVVPHNRQLLLLWLGHVNVQLVTDVHMERYLAKYVAKCDTSTKAKPAGNDVDRFLNYRTMGILECLTTLLQIHQSQASYKAIFLPTEFSPLCRMLKRLQHLPNDPSSKDVYYDNMFDKYLNRPLSLKELLYEEYFQQYTIMANRKPISASQVLSDESDYNSDDSEGSYLEGLQNVLLDHKGRQVKRRKKPAVTRFRHIWPYGAEADKFYEQKLCLTQPFTMSDVNENGFIFSNLNVSGTFMEECCLRNLVDSEKDAMASIISAAERGFSAARVYKIAREMVVQKLFSEKKMNDVVKPLLESLGF